MTTVIQETFAGSQLNAELWLSSVSNSGATVSVNEALLLRMQYSGAASARIRSVPNLPTSGTITIAIDWTPGGHYASAYATPYLALVTENQTRYASYAIPSNTIILTLGAQTDTSTRTKISAGISGASSNVVAGTSAQISWSQGITKRVLWSVDWDAKSMSVVINDEPIITNAAFVFNPTTPLFLEIANSDYSSTTALTEQFDNLSVYTATSFRVGGTVRNASGGTPARTIRAYRSDTGALVGATTSDPQTGAWFVDVPATPIDLCFKPVDGDVTDLWIPQRTPEES